MTSTGFIAILKFSTSVADRPTAIAQLEGERLGVRSMPGCLGYDVFVSSDGDTEITVLHEWTDLTSFDQYLASNAFDRSGQVLRPMMTGAPLSRRFRAELIETVTDQ